MSEFSPEEAEKRKRAVFESMSPRRQKHILKKGYEKWDPFAEPKDPIDIRKDKTKLNHFNRELEETLDTELGKLRTIKVSLAHDNDQRETYIWFAIDWDYLLVRFEQFEKGKKEFVINLTDATIAGKRVKGLSASQPSP